MNTGVKNAVGGGSSISDTERNDSAAVKKAVGGGTSDNVNAGVNKAVAIGGGSGIADNVNRERQLGRRDIVTDTDNGFVYQPREVRRLRKQQTHTAVVGTRSANGRFRGAQAPSRYIFVYRFENEASASEIESHVKDNGIEPRSVVTVSHADALYQSFKLTVSVNDVAKTLDADLWPEGIMVRRYRTQSSKWRESPTN